MGLRVLLKEKDLPCFKNMYAQLQPLESYIKKAIPFVSQSLLKIQKETNSSFAD